MCSTCTTALDTAATNAVLIGAYAVNKWDRVKDRLQRRPRLERDLRTWEHHARFMRDLGLDPLSTLGPPPAIPAEEPDTALAR